MAKLTGDAGIDLLRGLLGADSLFGHDGRDTLYGNDGQDYLWGGAGNDSLEGGADSDRLFGEGGDDRLGGGDGLDTLFGGEGRDTVISGRGGGIVDGGAGADFLVGGNGRDVFVFDDGDTTADHRDMINLFRHAHGDRIDLSQIDANLRLAGDQDFRWIGRDAFSAPGQIRYYTYNDYVMVAGNTAGNHGSEFEIKLIDPPAMPVAADFVL